MTIPKLLTEDEIKSIYEGTHMEAVGVYGWDRIVTTLVAFNVLRKKAALAPAAPEETTARETTAREAELADALGMPASCHCDTEKHAVTP
jgi:hypothetical protein